MLVDLRRNVRSTFLGLTYFYRLRNTPEDLNLRYNSSENHKCNEVREENRFAHRILAIISKHML